MLKSIFACIGAFIASFAKLFVKTVVNLSYVKKKKKVIEISAPLICYKWQHAEWTKKT